MKLPIVQLGLAVLLTCSPVFPQEPASHSGNLFVNAISDMSTAFLRKEGQFREYLDSIKAYGINTIRIGGHWRVLCNQCARYHLELNAEPSPDTYDFSDYFDRLDYAIDTAHMRVILSFNFAGKLPGDSATKGAQRLLPDFLTADDVMTCRRSRGGDTLYSSASGNLKVPRFEKPAVRALMLGFVDAVVQRFSQRYGNNILYYSFTTNTTSENEYPGMPSPGFCDTSPDAARAFRAWLQKKYVHPQDVSRAWGRSDDFSGFEQIQILDGQPAPHHNVANQAFLDFMAYRESAMGKFMSEIRDHVHRAGGKVMAQYGSVSDWMSTTRGTFGFGRQIEGYDLVVVDDGPETNHGFSVDYVRTNCGNIPFGTEADSPCRFGCDPKNLPSCCNGATFPQGIDLSIGIPMLINQLNITYERGGQFVDLANWDNFYQKAFSLFAGCIANGTRLAAGKVKSVTATDTLKLSLRDLYSHHHDPDYINHLIEEHRKLGGDRSPIAVVVEYDL